MADNEKHIVNSKLNPAKPSPLTPKQRACYARAKARALALLDSPFHLGGKRMVSREELHDRKGLR